MDCPGASRPIYEELTSRVSSDRSRRCLRQLERTTPSATRSSPVPLDAVLASNMISVGVDIDRLGLMTVIGQPKTTAEYIQATSRVGRQTCARSHRDLYNWIRPRDLSHYERFRHYHATFYRHVEAVSATPFSSRARDRGLPGAFVALARLGDFDLTPELAADSFDPDKASVSVAVEHFRRRAEAVAEAQTASDVQRQLQALVSEWEISLRNHCVMDGGPQTEPSCRRRTFCSAKLRAAKLATGMPQDRCVRSRRRVRLRNGSGWLVGERVQARRVRGSWASFDRVRWLALLVPAQSLTFLQHRSSSLEPISGRPKPSPD